MKHEEDTGTQETSAGRRRLLKAIAAAGAVLPEKWSSPTARFGALPAHVEVSLGLSIGGILIARPPPPGVQTATEHAVTQLR